MAALKENAVKVLATGLPSIFAIGVEAAMLLAENKRISLQIVPDEGLPPKIVGDGEELNPISEEFEEIVHFLYSLFPSINRGMGVEVIISPEKF